MENAPVESRGADDDDYDDEDEEDEEEDDDEDEEDEDDGGETWYVAGEPHRARIPRKA